MSLPSRGKRLVRRYPLLAGVPENERPAIVRAAMGHPLFLLLVAGGGLLLLPLYFSFALPFLGIAEEKNMALATAKFAGAVLLPLVLAVPLLSRFVMPRFIRRALQRRGHADPAAPPPSA